MLLVKLTYSAVNYYVSQDGHALTHLWKQYVQSFDNLQRRLPCDYGGYCAMECGGITFSPRLFGSSDMNVWPPPTEMDIEVSYTATNEASAVVMIAGKAHLTSVGRDGVSYDIYTPEYTSTAAASTAYDATLVSVATSMCSTLSLTLDSTYARRPSPTVVHTTTSERLLIDLLSDFCAFYTHLFYISGSTLYLVDMAADNGSRTLDVEFLPPTYERKVPVYEVSDGTNASFGSYAYGRKISATAYHGTGANVEAAYDDIITACNSDWATIEIPFDGDVPDPGEKISWTDDTLQADSEIYIRARHITYNFDRGLIRIEGNGALSAAS